MPADFSPAVRGALDLLTEEESWEEFGTVTSSEAANNMREMAQGIREMTPFQHTKEFYVSEGEPFVWYKVAAEDTFMLVTGLVIWLEDDGPLSASIHYNHYYGPANINKTLTGSNTAISLGQLPTPTRIKVKLTTSGEASGEIIVTGFVYKALLSTND